MSQTDRATRNYLDSDRIVLHPNKITQGYVKYLQHGHSPINTKVPIFKSEIPEEYSHGEEKLTKQVRKKAMFPKKLKRNVEVMDAPSSKPVEETAVADKPEEGFGAFHARMEQERSSKEQPKAKKEETKASAEKPKSSRADEVRSAIGIAKPHTSEKLEESSSESESEKPANAGAGKESEPTKVSYEAGKPKGAVLKSVLKSDLFKFSEKGNQFTIGGTLVIKASKSDLEKAKTELTEALPNTMGNLHKKLKSMLRSVETALNSAKPPTDSKDEVAV